MAKEIRLLTETEVAEITKVPVRTLSTWRRKPPADPIPFIKIGRYVRYKYSDIERWIERNTWDNNAAMRAG
jgi:predicted DNA-binding transcriptional regulator AlpA